MKNNTVNNNKVTCRLRGTILGSRVKVSLPNLRPAFLLTANAKDGIVRSKALFKCNRTNNFVTTTTHCTHCCNCVLCCCSYCIITKQQVKNGMKLCNYFFYVPHLIYGLRALLSHFLVTKKSRKISNSVHFCSNSCDF